MKKALSLFLSSVLTVAFFVLAPATASSAASVQVGTLSYTGGTLIGDRITIIATGTSASTTLSYQWYNNGSPIAGATANNYAPVPDDITDSIYVAVTASKPAYDSQTVNSQPVVIGRINVLKNPALRATKVTTSDELWVTDGVVFPTPDSISYDWWRQGVEHLTQSHQYHQLHGDDLGSTFFAKVNYVKHGYETVTVATNSTTSISGNFGDKLKPTISGIAGVGSRVTAVANGDGAIDFAATYQWYVGGKKIKSGTSASYKPVKKELGKKLAVKVTYTAPMFPTRVYTVNVADKILTKKTKLTFFYSAYDNYVTCEVDSDEQECSRGTNSFSGQVLLRSNRAKDPDTGQAEWAWATFRIKYNVDPTKVVAFRVHERGNDGIDQATTQIMCADDHSKKTNVTGFYWVGPWCAPDGTIFGRWHVRMNSDDASVYALKAYLEIQYFG